MCSIDHVTGKCLRFFEIVIAVELLLMFVLTSRVQGILSWRMNEIMLAQIIISNERGLGFAALSVAESQKTGYFLKTAFG